MNTEDIILGMIINRRENLEKFLSLGIRSEHFSDFENAQIFSEILNADSAGVPIDLVSLSHRLTGGHMAQKLATISEVGIAQNPKYYAETLHKEAFGRKLQSIGSEIASLGASSTRSDSLQETKAKFLKLVDDVTTTGPEKDFSIQTSVDEFLEAVERAMEEGRPAGVSTGLTTLDLLTHGLTPKSLNILGARPGVGKSELCCNVAFNASEFVGVAYFTWEMSTSELIGRMVSRQAKVNDFKTLNGQLGDPELDRVVDAARHLIKRKLFIIDSCRPVWEDIKLSIRTLVRRHSVKVVFIDYIQQITSRGFKPSERLRELTYISGQCKALAMELDIAIVCAAQLNRMGVTEKEPPELHHLKESGSLEQDGNIVMLLHRIDPHDKGVIDLMIKKNRHGPEKAIPLYFDYANHTVRERT